MNKRGVTNLLLISIFVFMMGISLVITHQINRELDEAVSPMITSETGQAIGGNIREDSIATIDSMALWMVLGLGLITIVLAFFSNKNPVFFFIAVVLLFIVLYLSAILSNNYAEFTDNTDVALAEEDLTFLPHFALNLPYYIMGYGVIILIGFANFLRGRNDSDGF